MEKKSYSYLLNILFAVLLILFTLSILPILILGFFAVPAADDYSYGFRVYHAICDGAGLSGILAAVFQNISYAYENWQGTHSGVFLMSLQPGVFGERFYVLTPLIMLISLCGGLFIFCRTVFFRLLNLSERLSDIIWLLCSILCVQLAPSPTESFFWYNGSVYYTFYHGLLLCTLSMCLLYTESRKKAISLPVICLLAIILGGGNYVTALQTGVLGITGICLLIVLRKQEWKHFLLPMILFLISFAVSIRAPGNAVRQAEVAYTPNALHAILSSFHYGAKDCLHWFSLPVIAALFILFPLIWNALSFSKTDIYSTLFHYPWLLTLYSYCLLSSMYCPPIYAMDGIPERAVNIIYYTFIPLLVLNEVCWTGWLVQRKNHDKIILKSNCFSIRICSLCMAFAVLLCGSYLVYGKLNPGKTHLTSVLALHDLRSGEASEYHEEYRKRFAQLHDDSVKNVVLEPLPVYPVLLSGGDFSEDPDNWTNHSLATYYRKESVRVASKP